MEAKSKIVSVAGGKGGTGKSFVSANLGIALAIMGEKVIAVDGDLGGSNLHNFLQVKKPKTSLTNFFLKENRNLNELTVSTPIENLSLLACGSAIFGVSNLPYFKKIQLMKKIGELEADYVIFDLGGGTAFNTLDFFNLSTEGIIVVNPEPNSRQDSVVFLKSALYRKILNTVKRNKEVYKQIKEDIKNDQRKAFNINTILLWVISNSADMSEILQKVLLEYKPKLILNKIKKSFQEDEALKMMELIKKYLQIDMEYCGQIKYDKNVEKAVMNLEPFLYNYPKSDAGKNLYSIASKVNNNHTPLTPRDFIHVVKKRIKLLA